ncbi:hypothetical protein AKJ51_04305 [candidate division MSBL1 archaeon SCGC-AAA382A20]|uniref:6-hydroxymethyl-7,8-dihydropterin pyrophosphokinase n=1 Tax=candidate division MSBL1 archaeon SCGC-AAA382A20 TaxID=1698280 RepID=A0A133VHY1_9EURY|nr:hypothetical protein AKJ51_04305 [candidate division MSBL1 archaeon SCGC-AAA382A20]
MKWEKWKPKYEQIVDKLKLDKDEDIRAGRILSKLINGSNLSDLENLLQGNECIVFGAGPSLEKDLEKLNEKGWLDKVLISADGATSAVMEFKVPEIIVTDLDGFLEDQLEAWRKGAWMVVHGHGDNIGKIRKVIPQLTSRVIGTVQVNEPSQLHNFGGFTDGDRAVFMANELGASKIILAGMDLGEKIGRYTGETDEELKELKLEICEDLLSWLVEEFEANIANVTSEGKLIPKIPHEDIRNQQVR